jgi:hypothetical protein
VRAVRRIPVLPLILALLAAAPSIAAAQHDPVSGVPLRGLLCSPAGCEQSTGVLLERRGDSLLVAGPDGRVGVMRWTAADRVEMRAGVRRHTLLGGFVGALVGLGAGALLSESCSVETSDNCSWAYPAGAGAGALLGLAVGTVFRSERWVVVAPP